MGRRDRALVSRLLLLAAVAGSGCEQEAQLDLRVCGDIILPPAERDLIVLSDGAVVEQASESTVDQDTLESDAEDDIDSKMVELLRITTRNEGYEPLTLSVLELSSGGASSSVGIDRTISFPRSDGIRWITVEGLRKGVVVYDFARRVDGNTDHADAVLSQKCFGVLCAFGLTCLDGSCELAPEDDGSPSCGGDE